MITNKAKKYTAEYVVENYDGRYFEVRSHTGLYHRVSPWRMFHTCEEAVETLLNQERQKISLLRRKIKEIKTQMQCTEGCGIILRFFYWRNR